MTTRSVWAGVAVAMQSSTPLVAQTITSITKANPGVVTYVGADPTNGDYILLLIQGMFELNEKVVRVANVNAGANTLELEGIDTTLFTTFSSGTLAVLSISVNFSNLMNLSGSGGEPSEIDATTIHDTVDQIEYGNFSRIQYQFGGQWDPADAGFQAMVAASQIKAKRAFKFAWPNLRKALFYGSVAFAGVPTGSAKAIVESPAKITSAGFPTYYST